MTREQAKREIDNIDFYLQHHTDDYSERSHDAMMMAIQALSQEPCDVSVSEKEPNEITEEVTLRFFKNSLKVRWHDFVIYNVEWLKKNWQMEMDIVCGVKPCDDAISREAVKEIICAEFVDTQDGMSEWRNAVNDVVENILHKAEQLPSVTQKSGKWINLEKKYKGQVLPFWGRYGCSRCGGYGEGTFNYCPNCGARMESEE